MRTKILLIPTLILVVMYVVITMIVPDWGIIQQKKGDLIKRESQLKDLKEKNIKVDELITIYDNKSEDIQIANEYIPYKIEDEDIIGNLIFYANSLGGSHALSVSSMLIEDGLNKDGEISFDNINISKSNSSGVIGNTMDIGESFPEAIFSNVSLDFSGSYGGMKEFFSKINTLKRATGVNSFEISKGNNENNSELTISAVLSFNSLKKYNPEFVDGTLLKNKLNEDIIEKIKNKAKFDVVEIKVGSVGKNNPFLP